MGPGRAVMNTLWAIRPTISAQGCLGCFLTRALGLRYMFNIVGSSVGKQLTIHRFQSNNINTFFLL